MTTREQFAQWIRNQYRAEAEQKQNKPSPIGNPEGTHDEREAANQHFYDSIRMMQTGYFEPDNN